MATTTAVKETSAREGTAQAYIKDLEQQKKWAELLYKEASSKAIKAQKDYDRALAWETLLKECWANIQATDHLAESLCVSLQQSIIQSVNVKDMAECTVEAFKNMVNDVKTLAKCLEALKAYTDQLKACLSTMDPADPLMAGLTDLIKTIDAAYECAKEVLTEMLQVLKDAQGIYSQIKPNFGLEEILRDMETSFKKGTKKPYYDYAGSWSPCPEPIKPAWPLKDHKDTYYEAIKADLGVVQACLYDARGLREIMNNETQSANEALSCFNSLEAALKAAQTALACKAK